jgi:hypothetical protein
MKLFQRSLLTFLALALMFTTTGPVNVQAQDSSPWAEVFDENGNLRSDIIDLGETTETPSWMSIDLPFGQSLDLEANYHRYQTADGNLVVLPSASTLFFMAMNPQESGLADSVGMMGNGFGSLITFLGLVAGDSIDWSRVSHDRPEYQSPDQFWNAVLSGQENVWTWFSGFGFITTLLSMSWNDAAMRFAYLMYLNGSQNCTSIPGGCSGVVSPPPPPRACPGSSISIQQPTATIKKIAPNNPLVVGQDTQERRGADIQVLVTVPPVIFTWYEPIYEEQDICRNATGGETPNCRKDTSSVANDGVEDTELVFKECLQHVEMLPDAIASLQATATLSPESKAWITGKLGQTHYGAHVYRESFTLIPGFTNWSGSCDAGGTCTATGTALRVPFADPGTFNLRLRATTRGASFQGMPITQPRTISEEGAFQVYVTLPALIP